MNKEQKASLRSTEQNIQEAIFKGVEITREHLREGISRDMQSIHILLSEVLGSKECIDALTDVFYERYLAFKAAAGKAPELPLDVQLPKNDPLV